MRTGSGSGSTPSGARSRPLQAFQQIRRELLRAEEEGVLELRRAGVISDDVMNRILRDLALEELRLDFGA